MYRNNKNAVVVGLEKKKQMKFKCRGCFGLIIMDLIRELNYTCNSDMFSIVFAMKSSLPNRDDRIKVTQWLQKIMKSNKTLSDLKLRNEFLQTLKQNVQNGKLQSPFNADPPKTALKALARHLPGQDENPTQDDENMAMLRFLPAKNGGFLLPKPLPSVGAYVYIAASSNPESTKRRSNN